MATKMLFYSAKDIFWARRFAKEDRIFVVTLQTSFGGKRAKCGASRKMAGGRQILEEIWRRINTVVQWFSAGVPRNPWVP